MAEIVDVHFFIVKMHTLNKIGIVPTTKSHQKGLTTPKLQKGANNPLNTETGANNYINPEKGASYPEPQ